MQRSTTVAAAGLALAIVALPAAADDWTPLPPETGTAVGLAWDDSARRLWVAGDGVSDGTLVGVDADGTRREMRMGGRVQSVQALAIHDGELYVGDIGDPEGNRDAISVLRLAGLEPGSQEATEITLTYPGGEAHDAAAMMVSPKGNIYLVTRGEDAGIYRVPPGTRRGSARLTRVADAPAGVTDGVFLPGGRRVALRSARGVEVIDAYSWRAVVRETITTDLGEESLTVDGDDGLWLASTALRQAAVPTRNDTTAPTPPPEPSESPSPEATTSASPDGQTPAPSEAPDATPTALATPPGETTSSPRNTGTLIALAVAGLVALVAGITTYVIR